MTTLITAAEETTALWAQFKYGMVNCFVLPNFNKHDRKQILEKF